jgi:predicted metal-dependent hydrolase
VCLSGGYLKATIRPSEQGEQREARIQQYLQSWYRSSALERLQEKTNRYAQQIGVSPKGLSVRNFRSRWGSCDKRGQVVFNWNIIKAPHSVVDYVVIHELCHLIHQNHSKDFWQVVGRHDAAYPEHRQWLKEGGQSLLT